MASYFGSFLFSVDHSQSLSNYYNYYYYGSVYLGSKRTQINTVWDTGSNWFVVEVDGCDGCLGSTYDYSESRKFSWISPKETRQVRYKD